MVHRRRSCPIIAIYAVILAVCISLARCQEEHHGDQPPRRIDLALGNSDEFAETVLSVQAPKANPGVSEQDYARITTILATTRELIDTAKILVQNERTLQRGQDMMGRANTLFKEVKSIIRNRRPRQQNEHIRDLVTKDVDERNDEDAESIPDESMRSLLRKKYSDHDLQKASEDEERSLNLVRELFETLTTFPECVDQLLEQCLAIINGDLADLGLATIEVVVHEKRNVNQDGYNKVVIITNELADRVRGRTGDGIVYYPFQWNDAQTGPRSLGVDGKWNCHDFTPEDCCNSIKSSVPSRDTKGNNVECHIFVPFGGVGNPRRNDRVFIKLSPDGRVHEPPIIQ